MPNESEFQWSDTNERGVNFYTLSPEGYRTKYSHASYDDPKVAQAQQEDWEKQQSVSLGRAPAAMAHLVKELDTLVARSVKIHAAIHQYVVAQIKEGRQVVFEGSDENSRTTLEELSERDFYMVEAMKLHGENGTALRVTAVKDCESPFQWIKVNPVLVRHPGNDPQNVLVGRAKLDAWNQIGDNILALRQGKELILTGRGRREAVISSHAYRFDTDYHGAGLRVLAAYNFSDGIWETSHHVPSVRLARLIDRQNVGTVRSDAPTPEGFVFALWNAGGTGISNFNAREVGIYEEAIVKHGDPGIKISRQGLPDAYGGEVKGMFSLHDINVQEPGMGRTVAAFWNVVREVTLAHRPQFAVPTCEEPKESIFTQMHSLNVSALRRGCGIYLNEGEGKAKAALMVPDAYRVDSEYEGPGYRVLAAYDFKARKWEYNEHCSPQQMAAAKPLPAVPAQAADNYWPTTPETVAGEQPKP